MAGLLIVCGFAHDAAAQSVFNNPITDTNPSATNPYTNGQVVDPNLTATGIGRGAGIAASSASNRFSANGFDTAATLTLTNNDYYTFTLTPNAGYVLNLSGLSYTAQASAGTPILSIRSNTDAFATEIASQNLVSGANPLNTVSLAANQFQNLTSAFELRIYGYKANTATTTISINDFEFDGSVVAAPEPTSLLLLGVAATPLAVSRSRRLGYGRR